MKKILVICLMLMLLASCTAVPTVTPTINPSGLPISPMPTVTPTETPTPTPTPTPTTTPTKVPQAVNLSGTISSETGSYLDVIIEWSAVQKEGSSDVEITATAYLSYYKLFVGERENVTVSINDNTMTFTTPAIQESGSGKHTYKIGTNTATLKRGATETLNVILDAQWKFNGTYSGQKLDMIIANDTIVVAP